MNPTIRRALVLPTCLALLAILGLATGVSAQEAQAVKMEIEGQPFVMPEFGAVIGAHDGVLKIDIVAMDPEDREAAYRKIDIKTGDEIMMINGKRVKSTADLEAIYNTVAVGEEITVATKRGPKRQMIAFPKGDPETQGTRLMVRTSADHGGGEVTPILALALLVSEDEGKVSVADVLPVPVGLPDDVVFTSGDVIVKLQDETVTSISDLDTRYSGIATGDKVVFELLRDGETRTFNFAKPEAPEGQIMMKKQ
ncbi:MAG: PDZ domain-containing protein [bacterium]|nr:PDZ domain-containing protein [bacterium]